MNVRSLDVDDTTENGFHTINKDISRQIKRYQIERAFCTLSKGNRFSVKRYVQNHVCFLSLLDYERINSMWTDLETARYIATTVTKKFPYAVIITKDKDSDDIFEPLLEAKHPWTILERFSYTFYFKHLIIFFQNEENFMEYLLKSSFDLKVFELEEYFRNFELKS